MKKIPITIIIVFALIIQTIAQTNYYVSPAGDDNNSGLSLNQSWQTIQKASNTLQAGDTVFIKSGVYNERVQIKNSGNQNNPITYIAFPGDTPVIDGTGITLDWWGGLLDIDADYITIQGLKLINSDFVAIFVSNSRNIIIKNNKTLYSKSSGIYVCNSSDILVDNNIIRYSNTEKGQECISIVGVNNFEVTNNEVCDGVGLYAGEGIVIKTGENADITHSGKVYGNYVHNLPDDVGIYIGAYAYGEHLYNIEIYNNIVTTDIGIAVSSEQGGLTENINIYNNIVYNNKAAGIVITDWMDENEGPKKDIRILNNTVYNTGYYDSNGLAHGGGIWIQNEHPNSENFVIYNNIVSLGANYQILLNTGAVNISTVEYNLIHGFRGNDTRETRGDFYQESNPNFADTVTEDFHLLPSSAAIDNGTSVNAPSFDYDGISRPNGNGYDIGAFEYLITPQITDFDVLCYPNPANNLFFVIAENIQFIQIINSKGQIIKEIKGDYITKVELYNKAKGIYLIRIITSKGTTVKKIALM